MKTKDFDALGKQLLPQLPGFTVDIRLCLVSQRSYSYLAGRRSDWLLAAIFSVKEGNSTLGSDRSRVRRVPVNQKPRLFEGIEVQ